MKIYLLDYLIYLLSLYLPGRVCTGHCLLMNPMLIVLRKFRVYSDVSCLGVNHIVLRSYYQEWNSHTIFFCISIPKLFLCFKTCQHLIPNLFKLWPLKLSIIGDLIQTNPLCHQIIAPGVFNLTHKGYELSFGLVKRWNHGSTAFILKPHKNSTLNWKKCQIW